MKKVGVVLAEARQKNQISLSYLAQQTKIRVQFLEAIEQNEFTQLPPAVFVKGFLQKYAREVGLDAETVLALFRRDYKVGKKGNIIPREFIKPLSRKQSLFTPRITAILSLSVVLLMIFGYAALQWYRLRQPPSLELYTPQEHIEVQAKVFVTGKTQLDAVLTVNATPVAVGPDGQFRYELILPEQGEQTITVKAEDRNNRATTIERKITVK